jgi:hypothetical protein
MSKSDQATAALDGYGVTASVPHKTDGHVDMLGPAPRMPDGKPDFSGIWTTGEPFDRRALGLSSPKDLPGPSRIIFFAPTGCRIC